MRIAFIFLLCCSVPRVHSAQNLAIFVSNAPAPGDVRAAKVLQFYLGKMTGQSIPVLNTVPVQKNMQPVFIGACRDAERFGLNVPTNLTEDAYFLEGKNGAFSIAGGGETGAENGVYTFLEMLGCRKYSPRDSFIPDLPNLKLPVKKATTATPAFPYRELWYEPAFDDAWARWHKLKTNPKKNEEWGMFVHTFDKLCPRDQYFTAHPE